MTSIFVTVTPSGRGDAKVGAGAGVVTDRGRSLWLVQPATSTAAKTTRTRATAVPMQGIERRGRMMVTSVSMEGVGIAGAAPIRGPESGLILRSAGLTEVHNAVARVNGLREGGSRRSAETALHL